MKQALTSKERIPLQCIAAEGVLIILVDAEIVKFATEHHEAFYHADHDAHIGNKVEDPQQWLESVARCLNAELGEDGSTLLTVALDKAIETAVEQACYSRYGWTQTVRGERER